MKKILQLVATPSAEVIARKELEDAKRGLLEAKSTEEYARNMAVYHTERIKRLTSYLTGGVQ